MGRHPTRWSKNICAVTGKRRFRDHREAVAVLHQAACARKFADESGATSRRRECRAYLCTACQGWHVTSQGHRVDGAAV